MGSLRGALRAAWEGWGLRPDRIEPLGGGTTHSVFRLRCDGEALVLKGYAPEHLGRAETEARVLRHLPPGDAYRTPALRPAREGLVHRGRPDGPACWLLMTHLVGAARSWHDFSVEDWQALGAALAALHQALAPLVLPGAARLLDRLRAIDPEQAQDHLTSHAQQVLRHRAAPEGARRYFAGRQKLLTAAAARLGALKAPAPEQVLHNDYNQYNFLFAAGLPPAVLDWERACLGPPEYEVVRCVNVACLAYPERAAAFIAAYRARRPLDAAALRLGAAAFLLEQAAKHWPVAAWLDRRPGAEHFMGQFEVVERLSGGLAAYDRFYDEMARSEDAG